MHIYENITNATGLQKWNIGNLIPPPLSQLPSCSRRLCSLEPESSAGGRCETQTDATQLIIQASCQHSEGWETRKSAKQLIRAGPAFTHRPRQPKTTFRSLPQQQMHNFTLLTAFLLPGDCKIQTTQNLKSLYLTFLGNSLNIYGPISLIQQSQCGTNP